jgi:hypothetical protein
MKKFNKEQFIKDAREVKKTFTQPDWKVKLGELFFTENGYIREDAGTLFDEVEAFVAQSRLDAKKEVVNKIKHKLYGIWANMPLTGGEHARKQMREFLEDLDSLKDTHE